MWIYFSAFWKKCIMYYTLTISHIVYSFKKFKYIYHNYHTSDACPFLVVATVYLLSAHNLKEKTWPLWWNVRKSSKCIYNIILIIPNNRVSSYFIVVLYHSPLLHYHTNTVLNTRVPIHTTTWTPFILYETQNHKSMGASVSLYLSLDAQPETAMIRIML